ncbi:protein-tyrosine phosphatase [Corticibacter populi]|nr:protein-tyrosine phosphatase [Corticibacter populi]
MVAIIHDMYESQADQALAERRAVALQGASNFRDLGGYPARDGRQVRLCTLYRSDHLSGLTAADWQVLKTLGVRDAIDFRGERESRANAYEMAGVTRWHLPIEPQVVQEIHALQTAGRQLDEAATHALMEQTYAAFVRDNTDQYRRFFELLLEAPGPLVFHCTAGKDRTGFAAALLLEVLGVAQPAIMHDYLLTNALYLRPALSGLVLPEGVLNVLWRVAPTFLEAAYGEIDRHFGGMPAFLEDGLGLRAQEQEALQARYLSQAPVSRMPLADGMTQRA